MAVLQLTRARYARKSHLEPEGTGSDWHKTR